MFSWKDLNLFSVMDLAQTFLGRARNAPPTEGKHDVGLKANVFGLGKNDETLFWEAVAMAERKNWMKNPQGRQNLSAILKELGHWEKRHFFQMIGKDTQSVTFEAHATNAPLGAKGRRRSTEATDEDDSAKIEKTTMQGNLRGAMIVAFFAEMDPAAAVELLERSGTLTGLTDDAKEVYSKISQYFSQEQFAPLRRTIQTTLQNLAQDDIAKEAEYLQTKQAYTAFSRRNWIIVAVVFGALLLAVGIWG